MLNMSVVKGDALYYEIALDEERIIEDGIYSLEKIIYNIREWYRDSHYRYVDASNRIKDCLVDNAYQCTEDDYFLLFHKKALDDYQDGVRVISVSIDKCEIAGMASLIYLMQRNEFPDSLIVAFLKENGEKRQGIQNLVKLLKKTKRTYRAIVLDVTNTGWEENCDYTLENCYLTRRMYSNLKSVLIGPFTGGSREWKIIPDDIPLVKSVFYTDKYFATNAPRGKECDFFQECGVKCFSFCLPVKEEFERGEAVTVDMYRLGWYMHKLIYLAKEKI